jgi:hypothetical protein
MLETAECPSLIQPTCRERPVGIPKSILRRAAGDRVEAKRFSQLVLSGAALAAYAASRIPQTSVCPWSRVHASSATRSSSSITNCDEQPGHCTA